ncbi:hypothetical protein WCX18_00800 [Sulfurimonas sp. HSL1-2]|uniref:hypothetical protein n=1 Tax=Thiomicrolovo zhangzhouensis TaxID=3131933 RepID=UPI0031F84258
MESIERITTLSPEIQNQQLRFFARADTDTRLSIFVQQRQLFHKLKGLHYNVDKSVLTLATFILAIHATTTSLDKLDINVIHIRGKNHKPQLKREKLLGYWAIVRKLKIEKGMSFRDISKYLFKYHKLDVSYSTIHSVWESIENDKKDVEHG